VHELLDSFSPKVDVKKQDGRDICYIFMYGPTCLLHTCGRKKLECSVRNVESELSIVVSDNN